MTDEHEILNILQSVPDFEIDERQRTKTLARVRELAYKSDDTTTGMGPEMCIAPIGRSRRRVLIYIAASIVVCVIACGFTVAGVMAYLQTVEDRERTPSAVVVSKSRQRAYLQARNGNTIYEWESAADPGIHTAAFASDSSTNGRGSLAVIGYDQHDLINSGQFVAYRADRDRDVPLWTLRINANEVPTDLRMHPRHLFKEGEFGARVCEFADVFPENPGAELIAVFQHGTFSQCSLRVYDLDGKMLYQVWHDGNIGDVHWMAAAKQIVCTGVNGEVDSIKRGLPPLVQMHPQVVFAVTPQNGHMMPLWINTVDHSGGVEPTWYRCLVSGPEANQHVQIILGPPFSGYEVGSFVTISLNLPTPIGMTGVGLTLNQKGDEVSNTRHPNSQYQRAQASGYVPTPESFRLGDLPPIRDREGVWIPGTTTSPREEDRKDVWNN